MGMADRLSRRLSWLCFVAGCFFATGCVLMPLMEPARKAGLTEESRRGLLPARVALFHQIVAQGKFEDAMTLTADGRKAEIRAAVDEFAEGFTITGAEIRKRVDGEGASSSRLEVDLQRYKVGRNVLENVPLIEHWEFSHTSGWLIASMALSKDARGAAKPVAR